MTIQETVQQAAVAQPSHSHTTVALWALAAVVVAQFVLIWILLKARGGWTYIATMPMTNIRSITAIGLFVATIVGTGIIGYLSGVWPPEYIWNGALIALTTWAGIEVGAFWLKRTTTDPTMASTQNIMAAQVAAGLPANAQAARAATMEMPIPFAPTAPPLPPRPDLGVPDKGVI